jgi:hypothetical protein
MEFEAALALSAPFGDGFGGGKNIQESRPLKGVCPENFRGEGYSGTASGGRFLGDKKAA